MRFGIQGTFQWCGIFGGTFADLKDAARCGLRFSGDYYLLYLNLTDIDILEHLNRAFGTRFPGTLLVEEAGFFTFNRRSATGGQSLAEIFPDAPVPSEVGRYSSAPATGKDYTSFWFNLVLDEASLFSGLLRIGVWDAAGRPARLSLRAVLDHSLGPAEAFRTGVYTLELPDFQLFRIFSFSGVTLCYGFPAAPSPQDAQPAADGTPGADPEYALSGTLTITLFEIALVFSGNLIFSREQIRARLALAIRAEPFEAFHGRMKGLLFGEMAFLLEHSFTGERSDFSLQGTVSYGALQGLRGAIYLEDSTPVLAVADFNTDDPAEALSLSYLFSHSVAEQELSLFDLKIYKKDSRFYYYRPRSGTNGPPPPSSPPGEMLSPAAYQEGFHLEAVIGLLIGSHSFTFRGSLDIDESGIAATIALQEPLRFLNILELGNPGGLGPLFRFDTRRGTMSFVSAITFLQADFGVDVELTLSRTSNGNCRLAATLSPAAGHAVLPGGSRLSLFYSKDDGFHVTGWPQTDNFREPFDFFRQLKYLKSGGGCGALADFLTRDALKTTFAARPSLKEQVLPEATDAATVFILDVSCALRINGHAFTTLEFPGLVRVELPPGLSLDGLPELFARAIAGSADGIVRRFCEDTEKVAALVAFCGGANALKIIATLICRGLVNAAAKAMVAAALAAIEEYGGIAALGLAAILAILKLIHDTHEKCCFAPGTLITLVDGTRRPIESLGQGDAVLGADGAHNIVDRLLAPRLGNRKLYAFNHGRPFVTAEHPFRTTEGWRAVNPEAARAEAPGLSTGRLEAGHTLIGEGGPVLLTDISVAGAAPSTPVYNLVLSGNHTYYANGYLAHNKEDPPIPEGDPLPPENLRTESTDAIITLRWDSMALATGYRLNLRGPDGVALLDQELSYEQTAVPYAFAPDAPAGTYGWEVRSNRDAYQSQASRSSLARLAPPEFAARYDFLTNELALAWQAVSGAEGYKAELTPPDGLPRTQAFSHGSTSGVIVPAEHIQSGEWRVRMRSLGQTGDDVTWLTGPDSRPRPFRQPDPDGGALLAFQAARSGIHCATLLQKRFADISASATATAMARAGYLYAATIQGVAEVWPRLDDTALLGALQQAYQRAPGPEENACLAFVRHKTGPECAARLHGMFPDLPPLPAAIAMASAGYDHASTGAGLHAVWPSLSASQLLTLLIQAFPF